jgi:hypothetical protein
MTSAPTAAATAVPTRAQVLRSAPSRRAIRRVLIVLAAGVVLTVGLVVLDRLFSPQRVTARFFAALAARDAEAALGQLDPETAPAGALLNPVALTSAGYDPPRSAHVDSVDVGERGDTAVARVSFRLGDASAVADLQLVRSGHSYALFQHWRIQDGVSSVTVNTPVLDQVEVAGIRVAAGTAVSAFPGTYQARLPDNPLLDAATITVEAAPGAPPGQLEPTVKRSALTEVGKQVTSYLNTCAISTQLVPPGCPFSEPSSVTVTDVKWTISRYPRSTLQATGDGVRLVTTADGEARVTAQVLNSDGTSFSDSDTTTFTVEGDVTVDNGAIRWRPAS